MSHLKAFILSHFDFQIKPFDHQMLGPNHTKKTCLIWQLICNNTYYLSDVWLGVSTKEARVWKILNYVLKIS